MGLKQQIKEAVELVERGLDKNIRICVTGLSGSGKTAFITSLINQLEHQKNSKSLPFWLAHAEGRILAVQQIPYADLHIPEFPYKEALSAIEHAHWPESTRSISQVRVSIKYKIQNKWLKKIQSHSHLNIDIIDYPGEWLLDLPLLNLDYDDWARLYHDWLQQKPQAGLAKQWLESISSVETDKLNESEVRRQAQTFRDFLLTCKNDSDAIHSI